MIKKMLDITEKLLFVVVAIFLVFIILLTFNASLNEMKDRVMGEGNLEFLVYLTAAGFIVTYFLKRLLIWEVHLSLGNPKKRRRKR